MSQPETVQFYCLDGDNIEKFMEAYLIRDEINTLSNFSAQVVSTLEVIRQRVVNEGGQVIYCAGDNIAFSGLFTDSWCEEAIDLFRTQTGCSASVGIGDTTLEFYLALKLAKSAGGGRVVHYRSGGK